MNFPRATLSYTACQWVHCTKKLTLWCWLREGRGTQGRRSSTLLVFKYIWGEGKSAWPQGGSCWLRHWTRHESLENFEGQRSESDRCGSTGLRGSSSKRHTHTFTLRTDTTLTHLSYALLKEVSCGSSFLVFFFFFSSSSCSCWESTYIKHKQLFAYFLITMASDKTLELFCLLVGHKTNSSGVPLKQLNFCLFFHSKAQI